MTRFAVLASLIPGAAVAHGAHAPVAEAAHGLAHGAPVAALLAVTGALGLVLYRRWRP